jgi:hypothetical protein
MAAYEWSPASADDIAFISEHARQSDRDELMAVAGATPEDLMRAGMKDSVAAWTGRLNGVPCCMFGVNRVDWSRTHGVCWMVGTDTIDRFPRVFLEGSLGAFQEMLTLFPVLCNYVDARHTKAIKWLEWAGAEISKPIAYGLAGLPFHFFQIRRSPCAGSN